MKGKQLVQMIAFVVREELKKQLQPMVERVLTEQYLSRVVRENAPARRLSLREEPVDDYEDHIPEQEPQDEEGIYHEDNPNLRLNQSTNENVRKLLSPDNPFAALYEGVSPLPSEGSQPSAGEVPLGLVQKKLGVDFNRMRELAGGKKAVVRDEHPEPTRRYSSELDRVVDTRSEQERNSAPQRREARVMAESPAPRPLNPMNAGSAAFPDKPISFDD